MNTFKNWAIALLGVLALSVNNGCSASDSPDVLDGREPFTDAGDIGENEQAITLEQSGHFGFRTPTSVGNLLCVPNLAGQACFYPNSKLIKYGQDSATMSGFRVQVTNAMGTVLSTLNSPSNFGGTGFVAFRDDVAANMNLKFVGVSNTPSNFGIDKYVTVGCVSGSTTQLSESIPGDYFKCSKATANLNVVKLRADFTNSADFDRALQNAIGHAVLIFSGLASSSRASTFETWQSSTILLVPPHNFTAWQRCELSQYNPAGTGYDGSGNTCLNF